MKIVCVYTVLQWMIAKEEKGRGCSKPRYLDPGLELPPMMEQ
jgi:hypothetical protein